MSIFTRLPLALPIAIGIVAANLISANFALGQTANDHIPAYTDGFLFGANPGYTPGFTDEQLADLAAGDPAQNVPGVGVNSFRPGLTEDFLEYWGYDIRVATFQHYATLGMKNHTALVGFPAPAHRDPAFHCPSHQSELFADMYLPIFDGGANGTPVNDANPAAVYFWKMTTRYKPYVRFWEIWNEPGFDYTYLHGYLLPGSPGNWWDADPDPCDYKLRAPIQHYVRLLRIAYEVIKSVDNQAIVLCGGVGYPSFLDAILRNSDNPDGGKITPAFPLRGGAYFDAIGYHSYPHFDSSTRTYNDTTNQFDYFRHSDGAAEGISVVKNRFVPVLKKWGYDGATFPEKLWLVTEVNVPRREWPQFQMGGDTLQRNFAIKAAVQCMKENFAAMHIYALSENQTEAQATFEFDQMGLYKKLDAANGNAQTRNAAGIAYRTASQILQGKTFDKAKTAALNLPASIGGGSFFDKKSGRQTLVLWAKTKIDRSENASATFTLPGVPGEKWLRRDWNFAETHALASLPGGTTVALNATPVFLTEPGMIASTLTGCAPLTVNFQQCCQLFSTEVPKWHFDGGNPSNAFDVGAVNVVFEQPGDHWVTFQTVLFSDSTHVIREEKWLVHVEGLPSANFSAEVSGGLVRFKNLSGAATSILWDFGDGTTSTEQNPTHVFYDDGNFTVTLTATNQCGGRSFSTTYAIDAATTTNIGLTADEFATPFNRPFRPGAILRFVNGWSDEQLADVAAGNVLENLPGAGVRTGRFVMPQYFFDFWGYDIRAATFQHYANLDLRENLAVLGFPNADARDQYPYCPTDKSVIFKDLYKDIWDGGLNGTPVNEANPYAKYVWETVRQYRDFVEFWQVYDAPDFELAGKHGWLPPGEPNNWWDFDPDPCDISLFAPVETYVRMLRITYEIVKTLDPQAFVVVGGIGYTSFLDAVLRNTDNPDAGKIHARYPKKGGAFFDAVGFNHYPYVDGSTSYYDQNLGHIVYQRHSDAAAAGIFAAKTKFENVLAAHGFGSAKPAKRWLVTEANAPRVQFGDYFGGPVAQRNYLVKALVEAMASGFTLFNVNNLNETKPPGTATDPNEAMGLYEFADGTTPYNMVLTDEGKAFKTTSELLYTTSFDPVRTQLLALPVGVAGYAFKDLQGKFVYVLWAKTSVDLSEAASATYSFPTGLAISQLFRKGWDWGVSHAQTTISPLQIPLDGSPVFLTESATPAALPLAAFEADTLRGCAGLTVHFTDKSANGQTRKWDFPGGQPSSSTAANPTVFYPTAGNFPVTLTVTNSVGSHAATVPDFVKILDKPHASFGFTVDAQIVHFQNLTSPNPDSLKWLLPGGEVVQAWNWDKYFFFNGNYPVSLVVFNQCGSDTLTKIVQVGTKPVANYLLTLPAKCGEYHAYVLDLSGSSPDKLEWFAPGGSPSYSTDFQQTVQYPGPGTYSISLVASNQFGADTLAKTFTLTNAVYSNLSPKICPSDTFSLGGQTFTLADPTGEVKFPGGSVQGCDSIVRVELQFLNPSFSAIYDTIQPGQGVQFCGSTVSAPGSYACVLENQFGCDSTVTLHLAVVSATTSPGDFAGSLRAFPNPFSENLTVEFELADGQNLTLELALPTGQVLRLPIAIGMIDNQFFAAGQHRLNLALLGLPAGAFWVVLRGGKTVGRVLVVKQ